ncbi:MAG TPA: hypothetical protein VJM33_20280 [Microthrixaceae bacterium]|nr:hypothetical protein [Microthrixaceae bacterium]
MDEGLGAAPSVWEMDWHVEGVGDAAEVVVDAARRRGMATIVPESGWELRLVPPPGMSVFETDGTYIARRGLAIVGMRAPLSAEPRITTPDGRCTLLLGPERADVVVVGDSLSLSVRYQLIAALGPHAVVDGQSGRQTADLVDELRGGLSLPGRTETVVIELGSNDAVEIAWYGEAELRAWAAGLIALAAVAGGHGVDCLVLVTASEAVPTVIGGPLPSWPWITATINGASRRLAADPPFGRWSVADWAAVSAPNHGGAASWFDPDELHLTAAGRPAFVDLLAAGARGCRVGG